MSLYKRTKEISGWFKRWKLEYVKVLGLIMITILKKKTTEQGKRRLKTNKEIKHELRDIITRFIKSQYASNGQDTL